MIRGTCGMKGRALSHDYRRMTSSAHYHGSRAAAYDRSQQRVEPSVRASLGARKISRHLPASGRIVDLGRGNGALLSLLRARDRIGVDAIDEICAAVRGRGGRRRRSRRRCLHPCFAVSSWRAHS